MAGVVQSDYLCVIDSWNAFYKNLLNLDLDIEQRGNMENGFFFDVKSARGKAHGVWLATWPLKTTKNEVTIKIEMHWLSKSKGADPCASKDIAKQVEELLLSAGAKCLESPVK